jgi:hypothetical protein
MSRNPEQALFAQFAQFISHREINDKDWEALVAEFGVLDIAYDTYGFMSSWRHTPEDRPNSTRRFLRNVYEEHVDIAFGIMHRVYSLVGGADAEELQQYPALRALEHDSDEITYPLVPTHSKPFLDIDNIPGMFYPILIENINTCYQLRIDDATLILTRKLLENLLIDAFRKKYGTGRIETYYDPDSSEFRSFYDLIEELKNSLSDFEHYSSEIDNDFIEELDSFRKPSNAEAHSIETDISDAKMQGYRSTSNYLAKVLFHIRDSL